MPFALLVTTTSPAMLVLMVRSSHWSIATSVTNQPRVAPLSRTIRSGSRAIAPHLVATAAGRHRAPGFRRSPGGIVIGGAAARLTAKLEPTPVIRSQRFQHLEYETHNGISRVTRSEGKPAILAEAGLDDVMRDQTIECIATGNLLADPDPAVGGLQRSERYMKPHAMMECRRHSRDIRHSAGPRLPVGKPGFEVVPEKRLQITQPARGSWTMFRHGFRLPTTMLPLSSLIW